MHLLQLKICVVFDVNTINICTVQRWFAIFKNGEFSMEDESHSGQPSKVDNDALQDTLRTDPHLTPLTLGKFF